MERAQEERGSTDTARIVDRARRDPARGASVQRISSGGGRVYDEAAQTEARRQLVQRAGDVRAFASDPGQVHEAARAGLRASAGPLPFGGVIQRAFGRHALDGVRAHQGPLAAAGAGAMGATAYTQGEHVVFRGAADLRTAAHEAAHVVQQRAGVRVPGGVGRAGDPYERHAESVAQRVVAGGSAEALLDPFAPARADAAGAAPVQMRRDIRGQHDYPGLGRLSLRFEERASNNWEALGEYGTIRFDPEPDGRTAEAIDLVQIASLRTNHTGQEEYDRNRAGEVGPFPPAAEEHLETGGTPAVKDLWRIEGAEGFHIDLTGDALRPRRRRDDPESESAYNAERRGTGGADPWDNPFDEVTPGRDAARVYLEPYEAQLARTPQLRAAAADAGDQDWRRIEQRPGFNRGGDDLREAELFDFPRTSSPGVFRFHTTAKADGAPWGTVKWGFSVVTKPDQTLMVDAVQEPDFVAGSTSAIRLAQRNFDDMMGNRGGYTAPERLYEADRLLAGGEDTREEARDLLAEMRDALIFALDRAAASPDAGVRALYLPGHLGVAEELLPLLQEGGVNPGRLEAARAAAALRR